MPTVIEEVQDATTRRVITEQRGSATPPILPRWLHGTFRVDVEHVTRFREISKRHGIDNPDNIFGDYIWYQEANKRLEEKGEPVRLTLQTRIGRQHYVKLEETFDVVNVGAARWGRVIFTRPGLMTEIVPKYRSISSIFGHGEPATTLTKRVARGKNLDTIGLEMEVNVRTVDGFSSHQTAVKLYNSGVLDIRGGRFVMPCYDGSLGSGGVEYKTGVFDTDFWFGNVAAEWRERFRAQNFGAFERSECGLHINIGRNNTFQSDRICHLTQAFLFSPYWSYERNSTRGMPEVYKSIVALAGRHYLRNTYCNGNECNFYQLGASRKYQPMRMGADRVEFRIFQSTTCPQRLKYLPQFCIEVGKAVGRRDAAMPFERSQWDNNDNYRKEWGRLVLGELIQNSSMSADMLTWIEERITPKCMKILSEIELPAAQVVTTTDTTVSISVDGVVSTSAAA